MTAEVSELRPQTWSMYGDDAHSKNGMTHIIPDNDRWAHHTNAGCWCVPKVRNDPRGKVESYTAVCWEHFAADGRES